MTSDEFLLAVDIGGTFTDIVLFNTTTLKVAVEKILTTYPDPAIAVLDGIRALIARTNIAPDAIAHVVHGTTLITNTLIEGCQLTTCLPLMLIRGTN